MSDGGWRRRAVLAAPMSLGLGSVGLGLVGLGASAPSAAGEDFDFFHRGTDGVPVTPGRFLPPPHPPHPAHGRGAWRAPDPDDPALRAAEAILAAAPRSGRPYDVARYFLDAAPRVPGRRTGADADPLVMEFFLATNLRPSDDLTPWCAAFTNWCLDRVGLAGTRDAGSQSFVDPRFGWGEEVWRPGLGPPPGAARQGDIAVFRHASDPARGHVAFFHGMTPGAPGWIDVLGGNQLTPDRRWAVSIKSYPVRGELNLVSIRTAPGLRAA